MPLTLTHPLFTHRLFDAKNQKGLAMTRAAEGFAGILGRMLARTLLHAASDSHDGFLGMGAGAPGEIYSSFMVRELGKILAGSGSMKPLVEETALQLGQRSNESQKSGLSGRIVDVFTPMAQAAEAPAGQGASAKAGIWRGLPTDAHGPVLLPLPVGAYSDFTSMPPPSEE